LWRKIRASDGAAGTSGEGKLFWGCNQNGLVWSILEGVILGVRGDFGPVGVRSASYSTQRREEAMKGEDCKFQIANCELTKAKVRRGKEQVNAKRLGDLQVGEEFH
jgi:hypothetical protein